MAQDYCEWRKQGVLPDMRQILDVWMQAVVDDGEHREMADLHTLVTPPAKQDAKEKAHG